MEHFKTGESYFFTRSLSIAASLDILRRSLAWFRNEKLWNAHTVRLVTLCLYRKYYVTQDVSLKSTAELDNVVTSVARPRAGRSGLRFPGGKETFSSPKRPFGFRSHVRQSSGGKCQTILVR
jgi:hypothetical protein